MTAINQNVARAVVGILGNIISVIRFLSPVPTFITIWKRKAVEEFSPMPYLATLLNCMLWLFYGLPMVHPHSLLLITINVIGVALHLLYLIVFLAYSSRHQRLKVLTIFGAELAVMGVVIVWALVGAHTYEKRSLIVGILCVVTGVCMYASPLSVMRLVIKTRSVEYMPFCLSLTAFFSSASWLAYGLIRFDIYLVTPSGLGVLFGIIQLILYFCYYRSTPFIDQTVTRRS